MPILTSLPDPGADARAQSERLAALIRAEIAARGPIDFERFMALALYAPGLGYYSAGSTKLGAAGDFVTAPELGGVFARCVAHALAPALAEPGAQVLELGAGSGAFAVAFLDELARLDRLPTRYRILETSADLRERQGLALAHVAARHSVGVEWLDTPPVEPWRGALVANEVIDALPVRRFVERDAGLFAQCVEARGDGFAFCERPADATLAAAVAHAMTGLPARPRPYGSEILPRLPEFIAAVTRTLERGAALFVDYGYPRREYYRPERADGTLVCHYRHRAHADPLVLPGLQDLTAFIDFTALAEAGAAAGLTLASYASQAQFLIASGLPQVFERSATLPPRELAMLAHEVKRLTLPGEMGERFKAMLFVRGIDAGAFAASAVDASDRL